MILVIYVVQTAEKFISWCEGYGQNCNKCIEQ